MPRICLALLVGCVMMTTSGGCGRKTTPATPAYPEKAMNPSEKEFAELYEKYVARYEPLFRESAQAWWDANTTGSDEAVARRKASEAAIVDLHHDPAVFARLKALKEGGQVRQPVMSRQLDVLYRTFLAGQGDPSIQKRLVELEADLEQTFNTHRSTMDGRLLTENDVRKIVAETRDSTAAEKAWKAYMEVGAKVDGQLREAVRLRNQLARQLGFRDFYAMRLELDEIDEAELFRIFDELDALTAAPFAELKQEIDQAMCARFGLTPSELRPWHFGDLFFQEPPVTETRTLTDIYQHQDLLALAKTYYAGIGLPVEHILARSDLYEKPGKSPHAFQANLDRVSDIRILCNLRPNAAWADTLLHELGHAVYDDHIDRNIPFILRTPSHSITTEGIALMFGGMSKNEEFLTKVVQADPEQTAVLVAAARRATRGEKLIFARWAQVMVRFEKGMYGDPDQNLGQLWWNLKNRYQLLNRPEDVNRPDYAAKNHIVTTPVYYHNYLLGDLFASQVQEYIAREVTRVAHPWSTSFCGRPEVGEYLRREILSLGNLYRWDDLTRRATRQPLSAQAFVRQLTAQ